VIVTFENPAPFKVKLAVPIPPVLSNGPVVLSFLHPEEKRKRRIPASTNNMMFFMEFHFLDGVKETNAVFCLSG
jgi:hypothetical protein